MDILDFFDIKNKKHLKAYRHLGKKGSWSKEFWEEIKHLEFPMNWQVLAMSKMTEEYINLMLKEKNNG